MNGEVGDYAFESGIAGFSIAVVPSTDFDEYDYVELIADNPISLGSPPPGAEGHSFGIHLLTLTQGVLGSYALDPAIFDLALWDETTFSYYSCKCGGSATAIGLIDTLTLTPIPEPSTGALLFCGLGALARRRRG